MPSPPARRVLSRASRVAKRLLRRGVHAQSKVSVVVTARESHAPFLGECLESLSRQTWENLQILVIPFDGGERPVARAVRGLVETEGRLVLVEDAGARTMGAARNAGAARATGEFLVFVGGGDVLPPHAIGREVGSLHETGSDFARGAVLLDQPKPGELAPGGRVRPVRGASLSNVPLLLSDFFVEGTVFRRSFWKENGLSFPDANGAELDVAVAGAYVAASAFDVVPGPGYRFMDRGSGRVVGLEQNDLRSLDAWLSAQDQVRSLLRGADTQILQAWITGLMGSSLMALLESAERATPEQWQRLRATVQEMVELGGAGLLPQVAVVPRLLAWLAAEDRRTDVEELVANRRLERNDFLTTVEDGVVYAVLPLFRDSERSVPDEMFVLGEWETPLSASLRRFRWHEGGTLELHLHALIRYVAMPTDPPDVVVTLSDTESGQRVELPVRQSADPAVTRVATMRWHNYDQGALTVTVDVDELVSRSGPGGHANWQLEVEMTAAGVTRTGTVDHRDQTGSPGVGEPRSVAGRVVSVPAEAGGVSLSVTTPGAALLQAEVEGRRVSGLISVPAAAQPTRVTASRQGQEVSATLNRDADGNLPFSFELPTRKLTSTDPGARGWVLRVVTSEGTVPIAWPEDAPDAWLGAGVTAELALHRTAPGNTSLMEVRGLAQVEDASLDGTTLTVRGSWLGVPLDAWSLVLQAPRTRAPGVLVEQDDRGRFTVNVPLIWDEWGLGSACIPIDTYRVLLTQGDPMAEGKQHALMVGTALERDLPIEQLSDSFRLRVMRGAAGRPLVGLQKPYAKEERRAYCQQVLRTTYQNSSPPLDENAVYLQSYAGNTATDSQLALHHELRRTHPHLTLYWGVADRSTLLPEGAVAVMTYTREWYDVLARAKYLVINVDFDRWFSRKPGQKVLQTFHGYPAKSMGIRMWRAKNFTPRRIELELDRTSRDWDLILTPAPEMDEYYRTEYAYDGPIFSHGYPRDDILLSDEAPVVRDRTRRLLGIDANQTVVLYAPTWRDDLATSYQSSPLVGHLDLETSSKALGDDFVLLMRGHRFHPGQRRPAEKARLIDVTTYPEINDLILASDVAVLDYSSLRFDFALTERPMLFLVPDLDRYAGDARGFLYPFEHSAPGPLVQHADRVVELLQDLDRVREEHRSSYEQFNQTYNYLQDGRSAEHVVAAFFDEPGKGSVSLVDDAT